MIRLFIAVILVLSPIQSVAKWFSEPEEIFETERCLGAFIDGAKILNDRLVESKISNELSYFYDFIFDCYAYGYVASHHSKVLSSVFSTRRWTSCSY